MIYKIGLGVGAIGMLLGFFSPLLANAAYPFPHFVSYKEANKLSHYSQKALAKNVADYYKQWKKDFLVKEGDFYRIATDKKKKNRTVSEGQGYGMMIVALMAGEDKEAQSIFDGLYRFSKAHPSEINKAFMTWQIPVVKGESDSAFDGDADIAYALLLASKQWGDSGKIAYAKEAKILLDALLGAVIGKDSHLPLLGDWVESQGKKYNQYTTRSSDFMLSHFRAFYRFTHDKRWLDVIGQTQKALHDTQDASENKTALVPDFIWYDKVTKVYKPTKRKFLEEEDDSYAYNACRVPMRIGLDALLNGDSDSLQIVKKMTSWVVAKSGKNPNKIFPGYRLSGKAISTEYTSSAFTAPFGVGAKIGKENQAFLDAIYAVVKDNHEDYYEDSINLLSQLIMIEVFWDPTTVK